MPITQKPISTHPQPKHRSNYLKILTAILLISFLYFLLIFDYSRHDSYTHQLTNIFNGSLQKLSRILKGQYIQKSNIKKTIFNPENKDKKFAYGKQYQVYVDVEKYKNMPNYSFYRDNGIFDRIQVSSKYDYAGLTEKVDFQKLRKNMLETISYQLYQFQQVTPKKKQILKLDESILNIDEQFIKTLKKQNLDPQDPQKFDRAQYFLATSLRESPNSQFLKQSQYILYDTKYNISNITKQASICIYAAGYKSFLKNVYAQFLYSIDKLNYTNYHIVYVDDNSPNENIEGILNFINKNNFSFKDKIKVVANKQHVGGLGNMYVWVNKLCNYDDIVIYVDSDDWFLGTQVLNVLNAAYQDPQIWFVYTKYLTQLPNKRFQNGASSNLTIPVDKYRNDIYWFTSHLKTWRNSLFTKIPTSYFIQYHLDQKTSKAYPNFMNLANDANQIFSLLQLCGEQRYKFVDDFLYFYSGPGTTTYNSKGVNCFRIHEVEDQYKARIKTPFKKLSSLNQAAQPVQNFVPHERTIQTLGNSYRSYIECINEDKKPNQQNKQKEKNDKSQQNML